jgi:hypothetical protein
MKVGDKGKSRVTILTQPGFVRRIHFDIPKVDMHVCNSDQRRKKDCLLVKHKLAEVVMFYQIFEITNWIFGCLYYLYQY